jgi:2-polyprenyl-3-methyl-5-hydroxy-6-metoxy-1,4-benzoquinol methylase
MSRFNEATASADELWEYCLREYESANPITQYLFNRFFACIQKITTRFEPIDRILEVGCGAGISSLRILEMLAGQEFEVSDIDGRYIQKLKETDFPLKVSQESVLDLQRQDNSFDCILLLEVLEHISDYERALSELFRVSRKYVVISVPNEPLWRILNLARGQYIIDWGNTPGHLNHWSSRSLHKLVSRFGQVVELHTPVPWIVVLVEKKR